jgi:hypothetical protein
MIGKKLTAGQRRALAILAGAGPRGCPEAVMIAHGFAIEVLGGLVRGGLARAAHDVVRDVVPAGGPPIMATPTIDMTRISITDMGRWALMM